MQFKWKTDFSDSNWSLFSPLKEKLIFFPEENFLIISYKIDEVVVVVPSSWISISFISLINIKSRSVAVIVNLELLAFNNIFERIGKVLLFSITPWQ